MSLPKDMPANTLSGLFMNRLGRIPVPGDVLDEAGFRMEVTVVENHHVEMVAVRMLPPPEDPVGTPPEEQS